MTTRALPPSAQSLIERLPPGRQRKEIENILRGVIVSQVRCMSKQCNGRIIANIYRNGKVEMTLFDDGEGGEIGFLFASRNRLDGFMGFECRCGNDSRLCKQEQGHVHHSPTTGGAALSKQKLEDIGRTIQDNPSDYQKVQGCVEIDGFVIEDVS
jgi:hypothetical protein